MAYTAFDRFVAWCRFRAARPHIRQAARVCDIGCGLNPWFLEWLGPAIGPSIGLDYQIGRARFITGRFVLTDITSGLPLQSGKFDHAVMLAVLEHLAEPETVLREAHRILAPGGSLVMTWPNSVVDPLLHLLHRIGLVSDEMESDEHKPRLPLAKLQSLLCQIGFVRFEHRTFEWGLNNLMVAHKP